MAETGRSNIGDEVAKFVIDAGYRWLLVDLHQSLFPQTVDLAADSGNHLF
ncbi:hypothetical protein [Methylomonas koyamae]|nr:hypothetical protein [Methylomonas koyamae]